MAALSIHELYEKYIEPLSASERERLRELLDETNKPSNADRKITDLAGLGASVWEGIDVDEYLEELRDEWENRQ